jgi:hypothetical protein
MQQRVRVSVTAVAAALGLGCLAAVASGAAPGRAATSARVQPVRVTILSPTHEPRVNAPWPVRVTATDAAGKPVAGTLTMLILFAGAPVGTIDKGRVYHFVGSWQERRGRAITWPASSQGQPLTFQVVVRAEGVTVRKNWEITVG